MHTAASRGNHGLLVLLSGVDVLKYFMDQGLRHLSNTTALFAYNFQEPIRATVTGFSLGLRLWEAKGHVLSMKALGG